MNQAIQFLEDEHIDPGRQAIIFSALAHGDKRNCAIHLETLRDCFGVGEPLTVFQQARWDIEEMAERVIQSQLDDDEGYYWLVK